MCSRSCTCWALSPADALGTKGAAAEDMEAGRAELEVEPMPGTKGAAAAALAKRDDVLAADRSISRCISFCVSVDQ